MRVPFIPNIFRNLPQYFGFASQTGRAPIAVVHIKKTSGGRDKQVHIKLPGQVYHSKRQAAQ